MANRNQGCFGNYDFNHIAHFAKKRFVDGFNTITLLQQARTDTEKEEVALVCLLDVTDELVIDIELDCPYAKDCEITNCRDKLRHLIESELQYNNNVNPGSKSNFL